MKKPRTKLKKKATSCAKMRLHEQNLTRTATHLHRDGIIDEEGQYVHEQYVVGGRQAEQHAQCVEWAIGEAVDLKDDGDDNGSNNKGVPETNSKFSLQCWKQKSRFIRRTAKSSRIRSKCTNIRADACPSHAAGACSSSLALERRRTRETPAQTTWQPSAR